MRWRSRSQRCWPCCDFRCGRAYAADPRYPDWPCAQAKVPEISLAAVWAGPPLDDVAGKWKDDAEVSALVSKLAARRIPARGSREGDHGII